MKINLSEEVRKNTLISHIVLHCLSSSIGILPTPSDIAKEGRNENGDVECELKLTINGRELDISTFVDHWQSQVERMIYDRAKELFEEKFNEVDDLFYDLRDRLKEEINKRLKDWEKEEKESEEKKHFIWNG